MMATTWVDSKIGFAYIEIDASTAERKKTRTEGFALSGMSNGPWGINMIA
jgi:hypothetical protein